MTYNCEKCGYLHEDQTYIKLRTTSLPVRGEETEVCWEQRYCKRCDTRLFDMELDEGLLTEAYRLYRINNHLPPDFDISVFNENYQPESYERWKRERNQ